MIVVFESEGVSFILPGKIQVRKWIQSVAKAEGFVVDHIRYVFCSDEHLWKMNKQFLAHDTLTDILTFDYSQGMKPPSKALLGEIFISIERVRANAKTYKTTIEEELHRVMIHGILHLCGYGDKSPVQKKKMVLKENLALKKRLHIV